MIKEILRKKKYGTINVNKTENGRIIPYPQYTKKEKEEKDREVENDLWIRCKGCDETLLKEDIIKTSYVCNRCDYHFRMGARDRINLILDVDSFIEYDVEMKTIDPLDFPGYNNKINKAKEKTGESEAVITGEGRINGLAVVICVMNADFMMGSMGSVVGEKITRSIEKAIEKKRPVIIFSASGGARMQEGILSLMQMGKTAAALSRLSNEGLLYISVLTDPTTGGVTASFATLGDIILAEPKALIGFAGPRVIEQTIRQKLPEGFQRSEFLKERGFVDRIVHRKNLKNMLYKILYIHSLGGEKNE